MKCYYHNDRDAVSQCGVCGKGLCKECTDKYEEPLCEKCGEQIDAETKEELKETLTHSKRSAKNWIIVSFIAMFLMGAYMSSTMAGYTSTGNSILSNGGETIIAFIFGAYSGLALTMGLEKCLKSKAAALLVIPLLGWIIFLYAVVFSGIFIAIPEFIKLLKIVKETDDAVKKLGK